MAEEISNQVFNLITTPQSGEFVSQPNYAPTQGYIDQRAAWLAQQQASFNLLGGSHPYPSNAIQPTQPNIFQRMWLFFMSLWMQPKTQTPLYFQPSIQSPPVPGLPIPYAPPAPITTRVPPPPNPSAPAQAPLQNMISEAGSMLRDIRTHQVQLHTTVVGFQRNVEEEAVFPPDQIRNLEDGIMEKLNTTEAQLNEIKDFANQYPDSQELQNLRNEAQTRFDQMKAYYNQFIAFKTIQGLNMEY